MPNLLPFLLYSRQSQFPALDRAKMSSALCTHHAVLPRYQAVYLMNMLINYAKQLEFDIARHWIGDWDNVADEYNTKFEGKRGRGSAELQTKKTVAILQCALKENEEEFKRLFAEAEQAFRAEKLVAEKREQNKRR